MITMAHIIALTAQTFEVELGAFVSPKNTRINVLQKWCAQVLCRRKLGASYAEVAKAFGSLDHSAVAYAEKHLPERLKKFPLHRQLYNSLSRQIDILNEISEKKNIDALEVAVQ